MGTSVQTLTVGQSSKVKRLLQSSALITDPWSEALTQNTSSTAQAPPALAPQTTLAFDGLLLPFYRITLATLVVRIRVCFMNKRCHSGYLPINSRFSLFGAHAQVSFALKKFVLV